VGHFATTFDAAAVQILRGMISTCTRLTVAYSHCIVYNTAAEIRKEGKPE